nr:MAG TPA: hypothetical protein [Caudoviricetes sp.]
MVVIVSSYCRIIFIEATKAPTRVISGRGFGLSQYG